MVTRRVVLLSIIVVVVATTTASILVTAQQGAGNRAAITAAAQALGGLERIRAVRNIKLEGYGQYAYQFGGGNITGHPNAPMKFQAANDLRRTYDLANGRFLLQERRNFLFPFAGIGGHSFAEVNQYLDGDLAFNVNEKGAQRVLRNDPQILQHDGVHMRRMWMLNNPVVLVRTALDSATTVSAPRKDGNLTVFDLQLKEGDKLSMAIAPVTNLPEWVRWTNPHNDLGQVTYTTYFTGYVPYGGLTLPLGYRTLIDWRNVEYFKIYVDNYTVDGQIPDLAAPEAVRSAPEPQPQPIKVQATEVAKGIWRLTPGGTNVFEFADHLTLYELGGGIRNAEAIIAFARTLVPGKPVTQVITSHHHFDHTAGLRQGIAEGLTVIARRGNEGIFREMADASVARLSRPTGEEQASAEVHAGGRAPQVVRFANDRGRLLGSREHPHGRRRLRVRARGQGDGRRRYGDRCARLSVLGRQLSGQHRALQAGRGDALTRPYADHETPGGD